MAIEGGSAVLISQTQSYWMLVLGVALMRIASPVYHISGLSQISKHANPEQISKFMGTHNAFGSYGAATGSISLSIFLTTIGWRQVYILWSVPIFLWSLVLHRFFRLEIDVRSRTQERDLQAPIYLRVLRMLNREFLVFLTGIGIREIGVTSILTFMTMYLISVRGLSQSLASLIFGLGPIKGIVASLSSGYLGRVTWSKNNLDCGFSGQ